MTTKAETAIEAVLTAHGGIIDSDIRKLTREIFEAIGGRWNQKKRPEPQKAEEFSPDVEEALLVCKEIESLANEMPAAGESYAMSVVEKMESIRRTILRSKTATANQAAALGNMCSGMARWMRD